MKQYYYKISDYFIHYHEYKLTDDNGVYIYKLINGEVPCDVRKLECLSEFLNIVLNDIINIIENYEISLKYNVKQEVYIFEFDRCGVYISVAVRRDCIKIYDSVNDIMRRIDFDEYSVDSLRESLQFACLPL